YLVDGNGLSDTCDGVVAIVDGKRITNKSDPQHWYATCQKAWAAAVASGDYSHVSIFGFLTDAQQRPVVQPSGDPLPGKAYITITTLTIPNTPDRVQRHWVDAVKIPYVVLPTGPFRKSYGVKPGDIAIVYRPKTGAMAVAVSGDCCDLGEASIKLHRDLGNEPITNAHRVARANRGIDDVVFTLVFPGVNVPGSLDAEAWNQSIRAGGTAALDKWGGKNRLEACAK
ncbi:MAG: glycoside hydrolase family 75 protein, partial [Bryobacteraceae bacterium]